MRKFRLVLACAVVSSGFARADLLSDSWAHGISHSASAQGSETDVVPASGGAIPNSVLTLPDLSPPNDISSALVGTINSIDHAFSLATNGGEPPHNAHAAQSFWFTVTEPMTFDVSGSMSGSAGYGFFRWLLVSVTENNDVIETLGGEEFETSGGTLSLNPFEFTLSGATGDLSPGIRYLLITEGTLQSENATGGGDVHLTVVVPEPGTALLGIGAWALFASSRRIRP